MFDDFIELDLLDHSETTGDLFSYYLDTAAGLDVSATDLEAAAAALIASPDDESEPSIMTMDLAIKQEDTTDTQILLDPSPFDQQSLKIPTEAQKPSLAFGDQALTMVRPDQLTIEPQATTVSLDIISLSVPSSSAATGLTQNVASVNTPMKATSSIGTKRSSPEPPSGLRKHAKTESTSKSKSNSANSRKSSISPSNSTIAGVTTAAVSPNTLNTTESSSSSNASSITSESTPDSPVSPVNTTLSPATLQFLLQQQEETPLIPQLFTGKLTREEIEETLARLLESTKHLIATAEESPKVKDETPASEDDSDDNVEGGEANEAAMTTTTTASAEQTHGLKTQPGIKTDDIPSSTDLKKMTSKERRQLRNKISARNFRVRRKEYIFTLEGQVLQHKTEARYLREAVTLVQEENIRLKGELEEVKRQLAERNIVNNTAAISTVTATAAPAPDQVATTSPTAPLSKENQSLLTSILNRSTQALNPSAKSGLPLSMPRPQSPILTLNLHKDVPNSSSGSTSQNSWKDKNPIMVHTTLVPEICLSDEFQLGEKIKSKDNDMVDRPWLQWSDKVQPSSNTNPFWMSGVVFELMTTFANMTFMSTNSKPDVAVVEEVVTDEASLDEDLDWDLQQSLWALAHAEDEDDMTDEQIQLFYELSQLQISGSRSEFPSAAQEDPNMIDWLYESMMARLVDMDLQSNQDQPYSALSDPHLV
ncbi:hypothetical protein BX616_000794 [Lobosporangium transversale]|nr:hypothetical protein BX616_000794 [Lobosporangium transversale]